MITTIKLDPITKDVAIPVTYLYGRDAITQKLYNRFKFFKGEWYLDTRQGLPWLQRILGKVDNKIVARWILRETIRSCPGIVSVPKFELQELHRDSQGRRWQIDFEAVSTEGEIFKSQPREFIIVLPGG